MSKSLRSVPDEVSVFYAAEQILEEAFTLTTTRFGDADAMQFDVEVRALFEVRAQSGRVFRSTGDCLQPRTYAVSKQVISCVDFYLCASV